MAPDQVERKLTAILSADVRGYSRLMGEDEVSTVRTLTEYRRVMSDLVKLHRGRVVDSPGDNLLADFNSVVDAVQSALEIQRELRARNAELPEERKMEFRIGINLGDVIVEGERIYGDGVNIAARLEALAEPGGVCISGGVYEQLKNKLALAYEPLGEQQVKNIAQPIQTYRVRVERSAPAQARRGIVGWRPRPVGALAVVGALVLAAGALVVWNYTSRPGGPANRAPAGGAGTPPSVAVPAKPSLAVLPFVSMSEDVEQEHFADGITENMITDLSSLEDLDVVARNSVFTYKGKPAKVQQIASELGARYVLEGSVQKSANRVRITVQLVDATTGHHLWADRYDRELKDVFAVQDEITDKVVKTLAGYAVKQITEGLVRRYHEGIGVITEVISEKGRLVVDHEEIEDFMAAMVMSYAVRPRTLLEGLKEGDKIRFTIDAQARTITNIVPLRE